MKKHEKHSKTHQKSTVSKIHLEELEKKSKLSDDYLDQLQRLQAEYENYRKRVVKEKGEYKKYLLESLLSELINVLDNMNRATEAAKEKHNFNSLLDGINIVQKHFLDILKNQGVELINVKIGDPFDPYIHHAVLHESSEEYSIDSITKILQTGYKIGDRILRPAMVVTSSGKKAE